jgi:peptidoglycan hydrolase-like protein with peptidoglycan-binding domain
MAGSVGSAGMETEFYGPATAAAVSKFQVKYRAEILSPLGLVNPTGYWGAGSRAKANALCSETVVTTPDTDEEATDEDEDEDMDEEDDFELGGEANLDSFEISEGDDADDVEEGNEDQAVA